ncbi:MAG: glycosyltransferase family 4 protein [Chloroflexi bacterium]|nr:glycosyltransferase family 4 protein [Chloroflexota bacterium]
MRILLWHGYLLGGTGSNVYTRQLARAWTRAGHEVTVFSQEPRPGAYDLGGAHVVRPDVGGLLPVFVLDRYEGYEVRLVQDCRADELERWVDANARALRAHLPADLVFCNHVLLGGPVGVACGARFAVKAHGSELEYTMRANPALAAWGRDCLQQAAATFVGSAHVRRVLEDVCGHVDRVHEVPPGVDIDDWRPEERAPALDALLAEARRDPPNPANAEERLPDQGNAERLARFLRGDRPTVVYFGKLIRNKGVQVLLEALDGVDARAVVVGFGDYRAELERRAGEDVLFTGPLEHRHLVHLLALADVCVVPSIFPEAFGMVAAEAAATGCPPLVARHSGLAEIAAGLAEAYPPELCHLAGFSTGDADDLRAKLTELLGLGSSDRVAIRAAARRAAVERWSWTGVAGRLLETLAV